MYSTNKACRHDVQKLASYVDFSNISQDYVPEKKNVVLEGIGNFIQFIGICTIASFVSGCIDSTLKRTSLKESIFIKHPTYNTVSSIVAGSAVVAYKGFQDVMYNKAVDSYVKQLEQEKYTQAATPSGQSR